MPDINKFNLSQIFNNKSGKTSASSFTGVITILIGLICFVMGCFDMIWINKSYKVLEYSTEIVLIGSALLGIRKWRETGKDSTVDKTEGEVKP